MTRVEQIVGGEVNNILDFGTGVGNSIPFLAQYFPGTGLFGTDVSDKSLTLAKERFDGFSEFSLFGYNATKGAEGVGYATTVAVVSSSVMILTSTYIITALFFG